MTAGGLVLVVVGTVVAIVVLIVTVAVYVVVEVVAVGVVVIVSATTAAENLTCRHTSRRRVTGVEPATLCLASAPTPVTTPSQPIAR